MLGEFLAVALSMVATYLVLDIYWFILCGFLLGFSGGVSTLLSVSFAYISDLTPKKWRTIHLGFLQAVIYIATAASAGVFNVWLQNTNCDFRPPSWLMVAVALAGLLYAIFMPESLPRNKRIQLNQSKERLYGYPSRNNIVLLAASRLRLVEAVVSCSLYSYCCVW